MVEIEWEGVDLPARERRLLHDRLRGLTSAIDPDGRARVIVEIAADPAGYAVSVTGSNDRRRVIVGAEVRHADLGLAIQRAMDRAMDLAAFRWGDAPPEWLSRSHPRRDRAVRLASGR